MKTRFGDYIWELRYWNDETMADMAEKLDTSVSFLSNVENGNSNPPKDWPQKIAQAYHLSSMLQQEIVEAAEESQITYKIDARKAGHQQRCAAMKFTKHFDSMDSATAVKIIELLDNVSQTGGEIYRKYGK